MSFAIVRASEPAIITVGSDGQPNLYGRKDVADRAAARMGCGYIVVEVIG